MSVAGTVLTFTLLLGTTTRAAQRELVFSPPDGAVSALPGSMVFAHNLKVGCALVTSFDSTRVVSFSLDEARLVDDVDLSADFGVLDGRGGIAEFFLAAHPGTGLVIVFGRTNAGVQKTVALSVDEDGALERRWVSVFPVSPLTLPTSFELTFDATGSLVFFSYYDSNGSIAAASSDRPA